MTPFSLLAALGEPEHSDLDVLFRSVEREARQRPRDLALRQRLLWTHQWMTAGDGLPPVISKIRRERLIRFDAWTTTWTGVHVLSAESHQLRVLRPHLTRDAAMRRALERDRHALATIEPVQFDPDYPGSLTIRTPPSSLAVYTGVPSSPDSLARLLTTGIRDIIRWNRAGLLPADLAPSELVDDGEGLRVLCLTPGEGLLSEQTASLARALLAWLGAEPEDGLATVLSGLHTLPAATEAELSERVVAALAEDLADRRHAVSRRATTSRGRSRTQRLRGSVLRLGTAIRLPDGLAAVGFGLDGHPTAMRCAAQRLEWGPTNGPYRHVVCPAKGLDPREARRLVRAFRAAPPNARLEQQLGGNRDWGEAIVRWLQSALELRTIRLLLENQA